MSIKKDYLVKKKNILNEIRSNNLTLQELRFFSIYLSKINTKDIATRVVRFSISDFQNIMDLGRINIDYMKQVTNNLLCKVINVPNERGGYSGFQLFKGCTVDVDDKNEWYVEIDAHDKALPLLFDFKNKFFTYRLWNALRLKSSNQLRMYEILKQYETIGERIMSVAELRELLGIEKDEYPRFDNFRVYVLDACQQALSESTDIMFTYEPHGKKGKGGKILFLKFAISKNINYVDQLTLDEFIALNDDEQLNISPIQSRHDEIIELLSDACDNEFDKEQVQLLLDLVIQNVPIGISGIDNKHYDFLSNKYHELINQSKRRKINNRFEYLRSIIKAEVSNK